MNQKELEDLADQYLREDAERKGMTFTEYCRIYGLLGPAQKLRVRRHEVPGKEGQ